MLRVLAVGHVLEQLLQPAKTAFGRLLVLPVGDDCWLTHRGYVPPLQKGLTLNLRSLLATCPIWPAVRIRGHSAVVPV